MADTKWKDSGSADTLITTGLNSLANNGLAASSADVQTTDLDLHADFEFFANGYGSSVAAGVKIAELYLVTSIDGTNYPDGHDASVTPQSSLLAGTFEKRSATGTGACRSHLYGIPLPARDFKLVVKNTSGQTLSASSNTLKMRKYKLQTT